MRICIAYSGKSSSKLEAIAKSLALGVESQGSHVIDIINIDNDSEKKLTGYKYILFGCGKSGSFSTKVPKSMVNFVKNCGHIAGKSVFAFTTKGILAQKFLLNYMGLLESEGVFLKTSSIIGAPEEGKIIGSKLHIK